MNEAQDSVSPLGPEPPGRLIERVARAAAAVACEFDVARVVGVILDQMRSFGATVTVVFTADVERRELTLLGQQGLPPDLVKRIERVPFDAPLVSARAATTREITLDVSQEPLEPALLSVTGELPDHAARANALAAPLVVAGRLVGVLTTKYPAARRLSTEETAAVRAIAEVFAASLETARHHERDRLQFESLNLATLAIAAPTELAAVLQNIVDQARALAGAGYAALGIVDAQNPEGPFNPWLFSGIDERDAALIGRFPRPVGLLGAVARGGRTIRLRSVAPDARFQGLPAGHPALTSFLGVPVFYFGRAMGNLYLANKVGADEFSQADQRVIEMLAQHAGIAVDRARQRDLLLREIAQRKLEHAALRESEERFRRLAESAPDVISRHGPGASPGVEYMSPAVRSVLGHRPEDYYRDPGLLARQIHPFDRSLFAAGFRAPESLSGPLLLRWIHPSGRMVWTESRFAPIRNKAGELVAVECISRDVTERKQAEAEIERLMDTLRVHRAWLQTVIESSPVGIVLIEDLSGKRITANREAESLFGRPLRPDGGVQQYLDQLRGPRGAVLQRYETLVTRALEGETVTGQQLLCLRPDGREIPVLVSAAPVRDDRAGISGAVVIYKDISALKELERLRDEWTSIIAHDLRQPVSVITMQAGLLAADAIEPALKIRVERIRSAADQLARMIVDLLDVSRVDARQLALRPETMDVVALAREVVERMGDELAGCPVHVEAKTEVPPIEADPFRLGEVLGNLLSNAAKYGYPGTAVDVTIEAAGGEVVVSVTNQGEGIPAAEIPALFARFHRARAAKGAARGVGLGLYIAKGLVEAHGGRIWAESVPGRTTTFRFALPARGAAEACSAA